jgi:hypothetical protein
MSRPCSGFQADFYAHTAHALQPDVILAPAMKHPFFSGGRDV